MRFCLAKHCTSFPAPFQDGHRCRILCLGRKFDLYFQIQGKTNKLGLFHTASAAFLKTGFFLHQVGFSGPRPQRRSGSLCSKVQNSSEIISAVLILEVKQKHQVETNTYFYVSIFKRKAQLCLWLFVHFFLLNSKILFIKNYNAMLAKGAILKFALVEYYRFTHLAQPKTF